MGKLWWASRVGLPFLGIVGVVGFIAVTPLHDISRIGLMAVCGAFGAITGTNIGIGLMRRQREPDTASYIPLTLPHSLGKKIQNYCEDCGAQLETTRYRKGFDPVTGKESYGFSRKCPNYDKVQMRMIKSGMTPMFMYGPDCGDISGKYKRASRHTHANEWKTDVGCPACIDQMLGDGIITDSQASELLRKTGLLN